MKADNSSPDRIVPDLTRRDLFRTVGLATGGAMLLGLPKFLGGWTSEAEAAIAPPSSDIFLELDGVAAGFVTSVEGGNAFADIVPEAVGPDMIQRKRPGPVKIEDLLIEVSLGGMTKPLSAWINDTLVKGPMPKNGTIVYAVYADFNFNEVKRLEFFNAVITEITLPVSDANFRKTTMNLLIRIAPQTTRLAGGGKKASSPVGGKSKSIFSGNFRLNIQDLEPACTRIVKVERLTAKRLVQSAAIGQDKFKPSQPGILDCSLLSVALPESDGAAFYAWFDDFVLKGNNKERAGVLEWLSPDLKTVEASVQLSNLGIVRYAPEPVRSGAKQSPLVKVDMYCESFNLAIV